MCLYACQEVHTKLWLNNVQQTLDLWMEGEALMHPDSKLLQVLLPIPPLTAPGKKVEKGIREIRMVPYFPAIGERAAVESISPLAAEGKCCRSCCRSCCCCRGRNGDSHLSSVPGRNPGLQIRGFIWLLGVCPTGGLYPK